MEKKQIIQQKIIHENFRTSVIDSSDTSQFSWGRNWAIDNC